MEKYTFLVIVASFLSGWFVKSISYRIMVYNQVGEFVNRLASSALMLIGSSVHKVSIIDEMCLIAMANLTDKEEAKILRNELESNFSDWKRQIVADFVDNYPEEFKWQLEFTDWEGAMEELTSIYKRGSK